MRNAFSPSHAGHWLLWLVFVLFFYSEGVFEQVAWAETWVCPRSGQSDLYTDHSGPGCRKLGEAKTYSSLEVIPSPNSKPINMIPVPDLKATSSMPSHQTLKKPSPFPEISLAVPVLGISTRTREGSITGSWNGLVARITVGYREDGRGPEILPNENLMPVTVGSLHTAVGAAARAVGYDSRYLTVRLLIPTKMDGPSAGGIMAVGIASALLGDSIRSDICMSGTIEPTLEIKPVGRLVDKMNACRDLKKTTMIVPDGLDNSHLSFTGAEKAIHVVEVHTLAEAYSAATGQSLRQAVR